MVGATRAAETPETSLSITIAIARYTWYLIMERIYSACGVKREDYNKRKFSGRPLKEIMRKSEKIFTEAKPKTIASMVLRQKLTTSVTYDLSTEQLG